MKKSAVMVNDGNWTEWKVILSEIIHVISKSQAWFQIKKLCNKLKAQSVLYYIHFEIAKFCPLTL